MTVRTNFDMDVLRTFVTGTALGNFAKAAERLCRSPSAISLQLRKLEGQAGQALFEKQGRGLALTEAGEIMLHYAQRILDLNDEATARLQALEEMEGWVRIGVPQDFAETWLPNLLGRFARAHPKLRVEARVDRGSRLIERIETDRLDLALTWGGLRSRHDQVAARRSIVWISRAGFEHDGREPLPLVAFDPPCAFRTAALEALDGNRIAWRHAFASPSLAGLWAATIAGLGVTARTVDGLPEPLAPLTPEDAGLPPLGEIDLVLHTSRSEPHAPVAQLCALIREALAARS